MSGKPTIEERMRSAQLGVFVSNSYVVERDEAARIAREYAAERTAPLVEALEQMMKPMLKAGPDGDHNSEEAVRWHRRASAVYRDADAALAAEQEARQ